MKKTPADLMQEATRLTMAGDTVGAAALFQEALTGQPAIKTDTSNVVGESVAGNQSQDSSNSSVLFTDGQFSHDGAELQYKLFVPDQRTDEPAPLLLMLHGCSQNAQDFALGTHMNAAAQAAGMCVLYPTQSTSANPNRCWNWFEPAHQFRGQGEPELLSELTLSVMQSQSIDPRKVFVAGLSAGGAMALILVEQYPSLFVAAGVHSGLPTGAASSNMEALQLMQGGSIFDSGTAIPESGASAEATDSGNAPHANAHLPVKPHDNGYEYNRPLIVFHGAQDLTVNCANADRIVANWLTREKSASDPIDWKTLSQTLTAARKNVCIVTSYVSAGDPSRIGCEYWQILQGKHSWSGGSVKGSYTNPHGPDATAEMVRFFLASAHSS